MKTLRILRILVICISLCCVSLAVTGCSLADVLAGYIIIKMLQEPPHPPEYRTSEEFSKWADKNILQGMYENEYICFVAWKAETWGTPARGDISECWEITLEDSRGNQYPPILSGDFYRGVQGIKWDYNPTGQWITRLIIKKPSSCQWTGIPEVATIRTTEGELKIFSCPSTRPLFFPDLSGHEVTIGEIVHEWPASWGKPVSGKLLTCWRIIIGVTGKQYYPIFYTGSDGQPEMKWDLPPEAEPKVIWGEYDVFPGCKKNEPASGVITTTEGIVTIHEKDFSFSPFP